MPEHTPVTKNLRDGTLRIKDGATPTPNSVTIVCDAGDLNFEVVGEGGKQVKQILDRGSLSHLRYGDEVPVKLSYSIKYKELYSHQGTYTTPKTPYEALMREGACADWVSTNDDGGGVYTVDLDFEIASPTQYETPELIAFTKVRAERVQFAEGDEADTIRVEGFAFITKPTVTKCSLSCETGCESACESAVES